MSDWYTLKYSSVILSTVNFSAILFRLKKPIFCRIFSSDASIDILSAKSIILSISHNNPPFPLIISSGREEQFVATTGFPQAIASATDSPNPSRRDAVRKISHRLYTSTSWSIFNRPKFRMFLHPMRDPACWPDAISRRYLSPSCFIIAGSKSAPFRFDRLPAKNIMILFSGRFHADLFTSAGLNRVLSIPAYTTRDP